jgi:hypothetical protein
MTDRLEFAMRIVAALAYGARWQTAAEIALRNFAAEAQQIADELATQVCFRSGRSNLNDARMRVEAEAQAEHRSQGTTARPSSPYWVR